MPIVAALLRAWFAVVLIFTLPALTPPEPAGPTDAADLSLQPHVPESILAQPVRISQIFGGGASSAPYPCDVIELFNASPQAVSLSGWSVQYSGATVDRWNTVALGNNTVAGHSYFLFAGACASGTIVTPAPDLKGVLSLDAVRGKVALVSKTGSITGITDPAVVDFVGYGTANSFEGSGPVEALSATTAALRGNGGCDDTDDNAADFTVGSIVPRNSQMPAHECPGPLAPALATFTSRSAGNRVILAWETVDEHDVLGFDLYRGRLPEGPWERVNSSLIPAHQPGSSSAWSYRYEDGIGGDGTWWHQLRALDLAGQQSIAGLTHSQVLTPNAVTLSEFRAGSVRPVAALIVFGVASLTALFCKARRQ